MTAGDDGDAQNHDAPCRHHLLIIMTEIIIYFVGNKKASLLSWRWPRSWLPLAGAAFSRPAMHGTGLVAAHLSTIKLLTAARARGPGHGGRRRRRGRLADPTRSRACAAPAPTRRRSCLCER